MSDYKVTDTQLTSVANAIRAKTGKSAQIEFPTEFVSEIGSISGGGSASIQDIVDIINHSAAEFFLVPYYTSEVDPTGYVLTYSSQHAASTQAWALFNNVIEPVTDESAGNIRWTASQARPQWVQIELPTAQKINSFYIATCYFSSGSFCKTYKVQGSNDGTTFTDIYEETLENAAIGKVVALSNETIAYKYFRIVVTDSYSNTYSGLTSFFPMYIDL